MPGGPARTLILLRQGFGATGNFGVALHPGVVDRDAFEAPFLAIPHQLAIIAVHQERVLRAGAKTQSSSPRIARITRIGILISKARTQDICEWSEWDEGHRR